ncbi:DUF2177 family protein [candidate division WWE3 bacterium]|jgi:uncharacterized membrane protein|uniref:DUF2177 family protein n=1 Tax=candidate division WWE3 bacterium TaxID=2053526 RepID=A0A3A4ZFV5_UNCKA|nr:MAG: DUF2177 family protein [candidate division WWE3 bacterium]
MNINYLIKLYFGTLTVFLGIDAVWLAKIAPGFYKANIGHLLAEKPNLAAAGIFYLLNIAGLLFFAVVPALNNNSAKAALISGALYGLFTYATYDLTNLATLKDWPLKVTIVDILWGMTLSALVSLSGFYIGRWIR